MPTGGTGVQGGDAGFRLGRNGAVAVSGDDPDAPIMTEGVLLAEAGGVGTGAPSAMRCLPRGEETGDWP